jgi:hypothetical protein
MITAKIHCQMKQPTGAGHGEVRLQFVPDYADGRNKEWSLYTPALSLDMTVKGDVADQFEPGKAYTLTFEPES